jgi:hypothetical protein
MTPCPCYSLGTDQKENTTSNSYSIAVLHSHYLGVAVFLAPQFLLSEHMPRQEIQLFDLNFSFF